MSILDVFRSRPSQQSPGRAGKLDLYSENTVRHVVPSLGFRSKRTREISNAITDNPLLFGPAWRLAFRIGSLPIKVYEIKDTVKSDSRDHPAYDLLRAPWPDSGLTRPLLISGTVMDMLRNRRAAWLKVRAVEGEAPVELCPIPHWIIKPLSDERKLLAGFEIRMPGRKAVTVKPSEICYFRLMADPENWLEGVSPFSPLGRVADLGDKAIDRSAEMFEQALLGRQWVKAVKELSTRAFNRFRSQMEEVRRDPYKIPVLEDGMELHDHSAPSPEALVQGIKLARDLVREAIGLPADESDDKAFYRDAVGPIADVIEQELERSLMSEWADRPAFPEFAFRDLLRGDLGERIDAHRKAIFSMQMTPDEARALENRGPLPDGAGAQAFSPLNLVPIDMVPADGVPKQKDTTGGIGGDEGKDTLPGVGGSPQARAMRASSVKNYGALRKRLLARQAKALASRLRGELNRERKAIAKLLHDGEGGRAARALPAASTIIGVLDKADPKVRQLVEGFMDQVAPDAFSAASDFIGSEEEIADQLADVIASRAQIVADRFHEVRADKLGTLLQKAIDDGMRPRDLAGRVGELYQSLGAQYADGIARTELAWAHEQAALLAWSSAGIEQIEIVYGGGPCTTGECERNADASPHTLGEAMGNVGFSFTEADAPPFHASCTCFAVAHVEEQ